MGENEQEASQVNDSVDAVEAALEEALARHMTHREWTKVSQVAAELEARRKARSSVVSLDAARRKRER